jgi:hypothetical protein
MCATLAGPLRSDSLRQSRGCAEAPTGSTCSLPLSLPIFEDDLGLGPNARAKGGRVRRRNHPPCAPCLIASCGRMPGCLSREGVSERPRSICHSDAHSRRPVPRVDYRPARVVALDRDRCSTQSQTPAPTAIPTTASKRSRARKAQLSWYSPLTTVAAKAQAKTPITASTARSQPEVLRQSSHPRTALEMRGKNSSIWFPSLALVRVDQSLSRTPS